MHFFYVKLPVGPKLVGREHIFHNELESSLVAQNVGSVLGWGDSLARMDASEPARVAFHRVDIEITDFKPALTLLQRKLEMLDAPLETEIHYEVDGAALQAVFSSTGWHT